MLEATTLAPSSSWRQALKRMQLVHGWLIAISRRRIQTYPDLNNLSISSSKPNRSVKATRPCIAYRKICWMNVIGDKEFLKYLFNNWTSTTFSNSSPGKINAQTKYVLKSCKRIYSVSLLQFRDCRQTWYSYVFTACHCNWDGAVYFADSILWWLW